LEPALTKILESLIDELECCSKLIEGDSPDYSAMLLDYARKLRDVENREETLNSFYRYATHYKGLADERPSNISTSRWTMIVERLRSASINAVNAS
jgi:hypothetical protein